MKGKKNFVIVSIFCTDDDDGTTFNNRYNECIMVLGLTLLKVARLFSLSQVWPFLTRAKVLGAFHITPKTGLSLKQTKHCCAKVVQN